MTSPKCSLASPAAQSAQSGAAHWTLECICRRLRGHQFREVTDSASLPRAAVALVLREGPRGSEFLAIHRAHRSGDPWSGHMALPGGRQQPDDPDLITTAVRETREEVGVDLRRAANVIGELDEIRAVAHGRLLDLVIRPIVFVLHQPVEIIPNPHEVQRALWIPLAALRHNSKLYHHPHSLEIGPLPAFEFQGYTIWGLTHRILSSFVELLASDGSTPT